MQIQSQDSAVREQYGLRSITDIFQRITAFFKCLKGQHKIGTEIQDIKARIQEISSRRESKRDPREDALFLKEFQLVGTGPREKLTEYILEADYRLTVVSIFGQAGLGKTTIRRRCTTVPR
ncbi:hypothetical protein IFM89_018140 [Coptis chinensis]|uniref:NB-ARC domain-containing protein n=1 Tax=Coptis chinensis TaxID=261450 RepID=A0A835HUV7_9MAGN|nr:hypothetical protein IFM89_018140 [Coptis chinensis]